MISFGGSWTHQKLEILRRYLDAYTTVLKNQKFRLIYVDAFAGEGVWSSSKESAYAQEDYEEFYQMHEGSPRIALGIEDRPFDTFVFIEKDPYRCDKLETLRSEFPIRDFEIKHGDANSEIDSFCKGMENYDRAVVFLDPFATQVSWNTVSSLAKTEKVDCWILFPLSAIARMMPVDSEPSEVMAGQLDRILGDVVSGTKKFIINKVNRICSMIHQLIYVIVAANRSPPVTGNALTTFLKRSQKLPVRSTILNGHLCLSYTLLPATRPVH